MTSAIVVVTGANGLVGSHVVSALGERGAMVRAVVRRLGAAPQHPGVEEHVGDFADPAFAATVVAGADALVTTVHPLGSGRDDQRRVGLDGTLAIAEAAGRRRRTPARARLDRRRSTTAARRSATSTRTPQPSCPTTRRAYGVVKRDVDAALARLAGTTRVLLRPPAILGPGASSVWNTVRPAQIARRRGRAARQSPTRPSRGCTSTTWRAIAADLATGAIASADDPDDGPGRGRLHAGQRRQRPGHAARLRRRGHRGARCRADLGRRAGVDRADPSPTARGAGAGRRASTWPRRSRSCARACAADRRRSSAA